MAAEPSAAPTAAPGPGLRGRMESMRALASTDTGRAAGLAFALMVASGIALIFTVAISRLLSTTGYGSLVVLLNVFAVLMVPGSALQATVAREVSAAAAVGERNPGAGVRRWLSRLLVFTVVVSAAAILLREPTAAVFNVDDAWAAAWVVPSGLLWLLLCVQRGALQGLRRYRTVGWSIVGEASARLAAGFALVAAGLGVAGAFLGTTLSVLGMVLILALPLHRALHEEDRRHAHATRSEPPFRYLLRQAWAPVAAFALIAALQSLDVVWVKHTASGEAAGAYAAASVAAKAMVWVAIGLGLYLLPEAVRRTQAGRDARPILARTLGLIGLIAIPMVVVYALVAEPLLVTVFGDESYAAAATALPLLAFAMSLLACAYLSVQYLLALGRVRFVGLLAVGVVAEFALLTAAGADLRDVASVLAAVQVALTGGFLWMIMRGAAPRSRLAAAGEAEAVA